MAETAKDLTTSTSPMRMSLFSSCHPYLPLLFLILILFSLTTLLLQSSSYLSSLFLLTIPTPLPSSHSPSTSQSNNSHTLTIPSNSSHHSLSPHINQCQQLCHDYQIIPTFSSSEFQSFLSNETYHNWMNYKCDSLSISCEKLRILPTLQKNYQRKQFNWKQKCGEIFYSKRNILRRTQQERLVVFAVVSQPMTYYGMLIATAIKYKFKLITIGWIISQNKTLPQEYYFGYKIISVSNILSNCYSRNLIHNNTIVMVVDGTDVIFQGGPNKILRRFHAMNRSIVFGGEAPKNIRTDFTEEKYKQQIQDSLRRSGRERSASDAHMMTKSSLREKDMKFMFLNSGCFIGRVGHLLEFYKYWVNPPYFKMKRRYSGISLVKEQPPRVILPIKTLWDARTNLNFSSHWPDVYFRRDQFTAIHMYLDGVADSGVDTQGRIFLSTFMGGAAGLAQYLSKDSRNRTVSIETNTTPAVLHFAGASKYLQCLSLYVKTFMDEQELDHLFGRHWRDQLVFLDENLDVVSSSLVTSSLVKSWIPRYPTICRSSTLKEEPVQIRSSRTTW